MENNKLTSRYPISFTGALTIAFIVLKLCNVINWSWIWVLSPLWIGLALSLVGLLILAIVTVIAIWLNTKK